MSDQVLNQPDLKLTREQIAQFVGDENPQTVRELERLLSYVNELYRKPSIALSSSFQNIGGSGVIPITYNTVEYANDIELDAGSPSVIRFLKAGRYRATFQGNLLAAVDPATLVARVTFWFKLNGVGLSEGVVEDFWSSPSIFALLARGVNASAYIPEVAPGDELQVFALNDSGFVDLYLDFSPPGGGASGSAANLFIERVY